MGITVHSHIKQATNDSSFLHVGGMAIQAITNVRIEALKSKRAVAEWGAKKDKYVSVKAELKGEDMFHFLSKIVELVMPRIKDWKGVSGKSGDSTGNITFGLSPEELALFPEIEVNYDAYPPHMIPGCHVTIHTSAVTDRDARLLLTAIGIPFAGNLKS
jgi:large subunit ribosomal protein L5